MKNFTTTLASGLLAIGLSAGFALAQAPAPGGATPVPGGAPISQPKGGVVATPPAAVKAKGTPKAASTPEGIECSAQADAQNKHGKDRVKFRKKCISDLKKAAKGPAAAPAKAAAPAAAPAAGAPAKK